MSSQLVATPDEEFASLAKPRVEQIGHFELNPEDYLVVCAGFEDRSVGVLENASNAKAPFNVLVITYEPFVAQNKLAHIVKTCQRAGLGVSQTTYNRQDPAGFGRLLVESLSECRGRVFLDISGMSRLAIVQMLVALKERPDGFANCFVVYAEAVTYPPTQAEAEAELARCDLDPTFSVLFLSSGVFDITVVPELSSLAPAGTQTRLIAFPSLNAHQLMALRAELQPSRITFIEGVPPSPSNQWREKLIARLNRLDEVPNGERHRTSTFSYQETLDHLLDLYAEHSVRERLLISPTGSKMQTVAVGLFRAFVEDVQIVYPTPGTFRSPDNYTIGVGPLHLLPLTPFSAVA